MRTLSVGFSKMNFPIVILLLAIIVGTFAFPSPPEQSIINNPPICDPSFDPTVSCRLPAEPVARKIWNQHASQFMKRLPTCTQEIINRGEKCKAKPESTVTAAPGGKKKEKTTKIASIVPECGSGTNPEKPCRQPVRALPNPPKSSEKFNNGKTILYCDDPEYETSGGLFCMLRNFQVGRENSSSSSNLKK